jgi:hypothetical protein
MTAYPEFFFDGGIIRWRANAQQLYSGFLKPDVDIKGNRRIIGKIWLHGEENPIRQ